MTSFKPLYIHTYQNINKKMHDKENITVWLDEFKQPLLCVKIVLYTAYT